MATIDQQFIEYIVKSLVEHQDDVVVDRIIDEKGVLLTLTVNPEDLGRVIGRRGATAQSLRTMLRALGMKNSARYNLKIVNNDRPDEAGEPRKEAEALDDSTEVEEEIVDNSVEESADNDDIESDFAKKSRQELAELDDLDI